MRIFRRILSLIRGDINMIKLLKRGLVVGENLKMMEGCIIDPSHCWHIKIGNNVTLAPRVHILAHDASTKAFLNYTKVANVAIGNNVFIGAGCIVLSGVTIGDNVVIGAGAIVTKDIPSNSVAIGNPAKVVCSVEEYLNKEKACMNKTNTFSEEYTLRNLQFSDAHKKKLIQSCLDNGKAFIE